MSQIKNKNTIELDLKQISNVVAGLLVTSFFVFYAGYYLGKKTTHQVIANHIQDDVFADKLEHAFYSVNPDNPDNPDNLDNLDQEKKSENINSQKNIVLDTRKYAAHLAGFGTIKAAEACVNECAKKGFSLEVRERISKNSKNITKKWYQVVTPLFNSREKLDQFLNQVMQVKKFNNIDIVIIK